jgi:hypothetical protein
LTAIEGRWIEWLIPALCCAVMGLQLVASVRHLSQTADESAHLYAGYRYWKCGDFRFLPGQPALPDLVAATPLLRLHIPMDCGVPHRDDVHAALDWLYGNDWQTALWRARIAISIFSMGLCLLVWCAARRMFGLPAAVVATVLLAFEPNALAHGALVDPDMALACTLFASVFLYYQWGKTRAFWYLPPAGIAAGLALASRRAGLLVIPILCGLAVADACAGQRLLRRKAAARNLLAVMAIAIVALGTLWPVFGFRFAATPNASPLLHGQREGRKARFIGVVRNTYLLPEAFVEGVLQSSPSRTKAPMFLLGRVYPERRWYLYPASLLIRCTPAMLGLLLLGAAAAGGLLRQYRREMLFLILPGGILLLAAIRSGATDAIRAVMPLLPYALILIAAGCVHNRVVRRLRWAPAVLLCVLGCHAASSLRAFPDYLSYANEFWGGPSQAYHWLSGNDQGQAYYQVRKYFRMHPGEPCLLISAYPMDIHSYGIRCRQYRVGEYEALPSGFHGTVMFSSELLSGSQRPWLDSITQNMNPVATLGGSALLVYEGEFDLNSAGGVGQFYMARWEMERGEFSAALPHAQKSVEMEPGSLKAHFEYCRALTANGEREPAATECGVLRALLDEHKGFYEGDRSWNNKVTPELLAGLAEAVRARTAMREGDVQAALIHARKAAVLAPESGTARFEYCKALMAAAPAQAQAKDKDKAEYNSGAAATECTAARTLQRAFPFADRGWMEPAAGKPELVDLFLYAVEAEVPFAAAGSQSRSRDLHGLVSTK